MSPKTPSEGQPKDGGAREDDCRLQARNESPSGVSNSLDRVIRLVKRNYTFDPIHP